MALPTLSTLPLTHTGAFGSHCNAQRDAKCVLITPADSLFRSNPVVVERHGISRQSTGVLLPVPVGYAETFLSPYETLYASDWWTLVTRGLGAPDVEVVLGYWDGSAWTTLPTWRRRESKLTWRVAYEEGYFPRDQPEGRTLRLVFRLRQKYQQFSAAILLSMHLANAAVRTQERQEAYATAVPGLESLDADAPPSRRQRLSMAQAEEFLLGTPATLLESLQEPPPTEAQHRLGVEALEDWVVSLGAEGGDRRADCQDGAPERAH